MEADPEAERKAAKRPAAERPTAERKRKDLLKGPVGRTLLELAGPMVVGVASVILFNIVDTIFVSRLGPEALAAMSFTFPVTFLVVSVSMGMGVGLTVAVSRAIGQRDKSRVRKLVTHGLLLANLSVVVIAAAGFFSIEAVFSALGAPQEMLGQIRDYMLPWYLGVGFLIVPMFGNSALRATGDTKTPSLVMLFASVINVVLDPLLIFGLGPFPRLELMGAALASVIAWMLTFPASLWVLGKRERLLELAWPKWQEMRASWARIFEVGLPATGNNIVLPLAGGILTRLVAGQGTNAVAAFGVGGRIDAVALIGLGAMGSAVSPFVGQNTGAGNFARVREALLFCIKGSLIYGAVAAGFLILLARPLAAAFSEDAGVVEAIVQYLYTVPVSYGPFCIAILVGAIFNALGQPLKASFLIAFRVFALAVPLAALGAAVGGTLGLFGGIALANGLTALLGLWMIRKVRKDPEAALSRPHPAPSPAPSPKPNTRPKLRSPECRLLKPRRFLKPRRALPSGTRPFSTVPPKGRFPGNPSTPSKRLWSSRKTLPGSGTVIISKCRTPFEGRPLASSGAPRRISP